MGDEAVVGRRKQVLDEGCGGGGGAAGRGEVRLWHVRYGQRRSMREVEEV